MKMMRIVGTALFFSMLAMLVHAMMVSPLTPDRRTQIFFGLLAGMAFALGIASQ